MRSQSFNSFRTCRSKVCVSAAAITQTKKYTIELSGGAIWLSGWKVDVALKRGHFEGLHTNIHKKKTIEPVIAPECLNSRSHDRFVMSRFRLVMLKNNSLTLYYFVIFILAFWLCMLLLVGWFRCSRTSAPFDIVLNERVHARQSDRVYVDCFGNGNEYLQ